MSDIKGIKKSVYWWVMNKYGITKGSTYIQPTMNVIKCSTLISEYSDSQQQTIDNLNKEIEDLANELLFYTSILEGTEQGKTLKENTKLKEGLNDIKSQLFDVNNCDTILTSAIEQILKNK